jgi:RNA polymerase sigma-70 factor (ECF subfamily)
MSSYFETPPAASSASATDDDLVAEIARGSDQAVGEMYDRYAAAVYATALHVTGSQPDAEDVVQETFLALWHRSGQFDPERGSAKTWLLSVARNRAIDRVRAGRTLPKPFSSSVVSDVDADRVDLEEWFGVKAEPVALATAPQSPEDAVVRSETRLAVHAALAGLDPTEREVIKLAYHEQLSQSEIARRLQWPIGTVKTRTRRALRNLRFALDRATKPAPARVPVMRPRAGCAPCS